MDNDSQIIDLGRLRSGCTRCTLRPLCLTVGIDLADLQRFDALVRRRRPFARGDFLFQTGATLTSLYIVRDGAFKSVALNEDGGVQVIGFHLPGELVGLDALGSDRHRCDAVALAPASVCEMSLDDLSRCATEIPGLHRQLLRVMGQRIDRNQDHVEMMGRRHAHERLAIFLHSLSERFGQLGRSRVEFTLPMSREDIANYLGLVIETVSRTFSRFQDDGIINVRGRHVHIRDHSRLEVMAHEAEERRVGG